MSSSKEQIKDYMLREHYHLAFLSLPDTRTSSCSSYSTGSSLHYNDSCSGSLRHDFHEPTEFSSTLRRQRPLAYIHIKWKSFFKWGVGGCLCLVKTSRDFEVIIYGFACL